MPKASDDIACTRYTPSKKMKSCFVWLLSRREIRILEAWKNGAKFLTSQEIDPLYVSIDHGFPKQCCKEVKGAES